MADQPEEITIKLNFEETRRVVASLQLFYASMNDQIDSPNFEDAVEPIKAEIDLAAALIKKIRDSGFNISDTSY